MSKYRYGKLVKNEFLPEHNNTWYYPINSYLFEFYSYNTMVGFIDFKNKVFYEWAHSEKYSCTTSKQATILSRDLYNSHQIITIKITIKQGLAILETKIKLKNI